MPHFPGANGLERTDNPGLVDTARIIHQAGASLPASEKASHRPCLSNGLTADFSLIYVKLYAGRALKIFI